MQNKNKNKSLAIFEKFNVRRHFDEKSQKWFFSVIDIVAILTESANHDSARNYWKVLKHRLAKEGSEVVTNCNQLKMQELHWKKKPVKKW